MNQKYLTPDEKLNLILEYYQRIDSRGLTFAKMSEQFSGKQIRNDTELFQIVSKLEIDSYLKSKDGLEETFKGYFTLTSIYMLTVEGELFIQNGGYVQKTKKIKKEILRQSVTTWMMAIGTAFAGLYGLEELVKWAYHHLYIFDCK